MDMFFRSQPTTFVTPFTQIAATVSKRLLSTTFALCVLLSVPTKAQEVGTTPGQLSVNNGTATYTIPIAVPPGVAGVAPQLSVQVSSPGTNGVAGLGGQLAGLSAISRCPASFAQDDFKGGVYFNAKDRFCLDGQRLIAIDGVEGASGTEYRTELNAFSKILSHGTQGNGPKQFEVWTKAGERFEYGYTSDSRVTL
jgi:hypothetical protein